MSDLPPGRDHSDEELEELIEELDEDELHGLKFGMLPARYQEEELTGPDVARMMNLAPGEHF